MGSVLGTESSCSACTSREAAGYKATHQGAELNWPSRGLYAGWHRFALRGLVVVWLCFFIPLPRRTEASVWGAKSSAESREQKGELSTAAPL